VCHGAQRRRFRAREHRERGALGDGQGYLEGGVWIGCCGIMRPSPAFRRNFVLLIVLLAALFSRVGCFVGQGLAIRKGVKVTAQWVESREGTLRVGTGLGATPCKTRLLAGDVRVEPGGVASGPMLLRHGWGGYSVALSATSTGEGADSEDELGEAASKDVQEAEKKIKAAEKKVEAAKREVKVAKGEVEAAEKKVEAAEKKVEAAKREVKAASTDGDKAIAQRALLRAEKELDLALSGLEAAREGVQMAQEGVQTAQEGVKSAQKVLDAARDSLIAANRQAQDAQLGAGAQQARGRESIEAGQVRKWRLGFNSSDQMRELLEEQGVSVRSKEESQTLSIPLADEQMFDVKDRAEVVLDVLEEWFKRFETLRSLQPGGRGSKIPHVVLPASPGMGKSRLLDVLAASPGRKDSGRLVKETAVRSFFENGACSPEVARLRREFGERILNAVGVCATFNGPSGREFDQEIVPDAEQALALRLLWGYFVDSNVTGWKDFVLNCAGPAVAAKVSLSPVLKLVEQDCGPDRHVIVCVDELMLCAGGRPEREVTDTANAILGSFGSPVLDNQAFQRVHVAFQALDTSLWETG